MDMMEKNTLLYRLWRVSLRSRCRYNIAAAALDARGVVLAIATNTPHLRKTHGDMHAEMRALRAGGPSTARLLLLRTGKGGALRPVHPCAECARVLQKLNIKVEAVWVQD